MTYKSYYPIASGLPRTAHALRPMRIDRNEVPIHYEATTFPRGAYSGCELQIRRMECFGMLTKRDGQLQGTWFLDVLDAQGDILDTLEVNAAGVKYMRRTLFMQREPRRWVSPATARKLTREARQVVRHRRHPYRQGMRMTTAAATLDSSTAADAVGIPHDRGVRPLTPLQARIVAALEKMPGRRADWCDLGRMLWPMDKHPRAWNYSSNGGPPGWAMSLSRAVGQLQRAGLVHDDWKAAGKRSVRLLRPTPGDSFPRTPN